MNFLQLLVVIGVVLALWFFVRRIQSTDKKTLNEWISIQKSSFFHVVTFLCIALLLVLGIFVILYVVFALSGRLAANFYVPFLEGIPGVKTFLIKNATQDNDFLMVLEVVLAFIAITGFGIYKWVSKEIKDENKEGLTKIDSGYKEANDQLSKRITELSETEIAANRAEGAVTFAQALWYQYYYGKSYFSKEIEEREEGLESYDFLLDRAVYEVKRAAEALGNLLERQEYERLAFLCRNNLAFYTAVRVAHGKDRESDYEKDQYQNDKKTAEDMSFCIFKNVQEKEEKEQVSGQRMSASEHENVYIRIATRALVLWVFAENNEVEKQKARDLLHKLFQDPRRSEEKLETRLKRTWEFILGKEEFEKEFFSLPDKKNNQ